MSARTPPEQHAPPVQWLRVRYAKRGRARFTSHRDFGRAFERALRRAQIPMAYSSGFSPHPRISYANAAPTGAASEAEYLEIGLSEERDPEQVRVGLDAALPEGLSIVAVAAAPPGSLAEKLTASWWRAEVSGIPELVMRRAVARFLAETTVTVERLTKNGLRAFDARAAVLVLEQEGEPGPDSVLLQMLIAHHTPLVRPDDVLAALAHLDSGWAPDRPPVLTRTSQGELRPGTEDLISPL